MARLKNFERCGIIEGNLKGGSDIAPNVPPSTSALGFPKVRTERVRHGEIKMTNEGWKKLFHGWDLQKGVDWAELL